MKNKLKKNFCAYFEVTQSNVNISFTIIVGQFSINICKHYCCTYTNLITCKWNGVCFRVQTSLSVFSIFVPEKNPMLIKKQSNFKIIFVFKRTKHIWFLNYICYYINTYHEDQEGTPSLDKLVRSCFPKRQLPHAGGYPDRPGEGTDLLLHVYDHCL